MNTNRFNLRFVAAIKLMALMLAAVTMFTACGTTTPPAGPDTNNATNAVTGSRDEDITLREGDLLKITFPGSPNLDTTQPIRRDGKLNMPLVGEVAAAGMTPVELQDKLVQAYASQLSTKEVVVSVQSSTFPVYVTGEVMHPGKVSSDHPIDALQAVMEAGGFNYDTADMKNVRIDRIENGVMKHYTVNLKSLLKGDETKPFYLKPDDIIYVPQRLF
jgi:polysaccharide export outer membrane protein